MPFICPTCQHHTLEIMQTLELPADDVWDENTFHLVKCHRCGLHAAALYQESRRGRLEDETWQHIGVPIDKLTFRQLAERLHTCPVPQDPRCLCDVHQNPGIDRLFEFPSPTFPMILAPTA